MLLQCQCSPVSPCAAFHLRCGSPVVQPLWAPTRDREKPNVSGAESCEGEGSAGWAERGERIIHSFGFGEELGSSGALCPMGAMHPESPGELDWARERVCQCHPARSPQTISELLKRGWVPRVGQGCRTCVCLCLLLLCRAFSLAGALCCPGICPSWGLEQKCWSDWSRNLKLGYVNICFPAGFIFSNPSWCHQPKLLTTILQGRLRQVPQWSLRNHKHEW